MARLTFPKFDPTVTLDSNREAMRKLGLEHTIDRLEREGASTSMGRLIEACEREQLDEVDPQTIFKLGYGAAGAIATSPIWAPALGKAIDAGSSALIDRLPKKKNRLDLVRDAGRNKEAEQCHQRGGDDCLCADGFHYDRGAKKCMKNTLGSGIKRFFKKK